MIRANTFVKRSLALVAICAFSNSVVMLGQKPEDRPAAHAREDRSFADAPAPIQFAGVPEDWSHHHVIFSNPGTADDAARNGTYAKWSTIVNNPRFGFQQQKRNNRRGGSGLIHVAPTALTTDWSMDLGSGATVGAGQYPAKYTFSYTTASCTDWVVYNTGAAGVSGGQANIEAYTNIYSSTCPSSPNPVPTVYWAYYSGTGKALTSPVLSNDGTKVAYIENTGGGAFLRIIKWKSGQGTASASVPPDHPYTNTTAGNGSNTAWGTCPSGSSCMISVAFQNSKQDTISAPFYEYTSADTLWVGDASGNLHEFTGVFNGTPGEVVTGGWPIPVSGNILASPVFDSVSGNIFVGDSGGILYSYKASTAAHQMTSSKLTATGNTTGIVDGPMIDSTTGEVYVPVGNDANTSASVGCESATSGCSGVFQFSATNTTVATGGTSCVASSNTMWTGSGFNCGVEAIFGVGAYNNMYGGSFDQSYYSAGTGKAGYLWECSPSNAHGTTIAPRLAAVAMQSNGSITPSGDVISPNTGDNVTTIISSLTSNIAGVACSPVTEFYNAGNSTAITKLGAAITTTTQTSITVNSNTGIVAGDYIEVGSEAMLVTATSGATGLTVDRGQIGTAASTYSSGASVTIPAVDYLYLSVTEDGNIGQDLTTCAGACLYNIAIGTASGAYVATCDTGVSPFTGNCPIEGLTENGGTSGIIIDNYGTAAGESQIYFTTLANQSCNGNGTTGSNGTGGCAVQTSQIVP